MTGLAVAGAILGLSALSPAGSWKGKSTPESNLQSADLVLWGGRIVTLDSGSPEVEAVAVHDQRITAIGKRSQLQRLVGPATHILDLEGRLAIPGFIEGHGHFMALGEAQAQLDLSQLTSWQQVIDAVKQTASHRQSGQWILGRGWHQEKWKDPPKSSLDGFPTHHDLSRVSPDHPVLLTHASGHAALANAEAMRRAGISAATPSPAGGEIARDAAGQPTGLFLERAQKLLSEAVSKDQESYSDHRISRRLRRQAAAASEACLENGITSFQDAGSSFETVEFFQNLLKQGGLPVRLYVMLSETNQAIEQRLDAYPLIDYGGHRLTVRAIKRFMDGALGSHGAWLLNPYKDKPQSSGLNTTPLDELKASARLAAEQGFQLCIHAIGDRANREVLDLYEEIFHQSPASARSRWRIEHAQHIHPSDFSRFSRLGVLASIQPIHAVSDGPWVPRRLGEKRAEEGAYAWKKLLDAGTLLVSGTDVPVESLNPILNFHAAVTREMENGEAFFPDQRISREQALRSLTLNAAYGAFEENQKGSITPGKLADITVLSQDILKISEEEIPNTRVDYTISGGKILFAREVQVGNDGQGKDSEGRNQ